MLKELSELKSAGAIAVKLEFESEFFDEKSAFELSELIHRIDLELCIKLGGLSSIQDLRYCKNLCANSIVAPMIESAYGVEKFLFCVNQVFEENPPKLYLNIETKNAFTHLDEIIKECDERICGFIIGRSDLKNSLKISNANDEKILNYCQSLDEISSKLDKEFIIGGKINSDAIPFLKKLPNLTHFETRKVVYKISSLNDNCIKKSLDFELKLLKSKRVHLKEDLERIKFIEASMKLEV